MEKAKHSRRSIRGYVRAVLICILIVFGAPFACAGYLILREDATQYFSSSQVAEICTGSKLPADSLFCSESQYQVAWGLRETVEQVYPPGATTLIHLKAMITLDLHSTDEIRLSYTLPGDRYLTIFYENELVTEYEVENHEGDDLSRP